MRQFIDNSANTPSLLPALLDETLATRITHGDWPTRAEICHHDLVLLPALFQASALQSLEHLARVYQGPMSFSSGPRSGEMVPVNRVNAHMLFKLGLTVYMPEISACLPDAPAFLRRLEGELGVPTGSVRIGAFASPKGDGVACHYDAEDIISVQLVGTKRFHIAPVSEMPWPTGMQYAPGARTFPDLFPQVNNGYPDWLNAEFETIDMRPGSVLFMPRGTWHRTDANEDSLAVSIIVSAQTAADTLLDQLRMLLLQDPAWRRPLYGLAGNNTARAMALAHARELLDTLPACVGSLRAEDLMRQVADENQRLALLDADSRFMSLPNARLAIERGANGRPQATVIIHDEEFGERAGARMDLSDQALAALEWLAAQPRPFTARQFIVRFPALADAELMRMLAAGVKTGLLKLLWYPAWRPEITTRVTTPA